MADGNQGNGPKKPTTTSFNNSVGGKEAPPKNNHPSITKQQQRSALKLDSAQSKPKTAGKAGEVASARGALHFNVDASDKLDTKSTVHVKESAKKYVSKDSGKTYADPKAIAAAKNVDKSNAKKKDAQSKKSSGIHPAPKPRGVMSKKTPVKSSSSQSKSSENKQKDPQQQKRDNYNKVVKEALRADKQKQADKNKSPDNSKGR